RDPAASVQPGKGCSWRRRGRAGARADPPENAARDANEQAAEIRRVVQSERERDRGRQARIAAPDRERKHPGRQRIGRQSRYEKRLAEEGGTAAHGETHREKRGDASAGVQTGTL